MAAEGMILKVEIVMSLGLASFAYVKDSWVALPAGRTLSEIVIVREIGWHLNLQCKYICISEPNIF